MPAANRTFRIFVSSTFADLKVERNVLQDEVFPKLQKLCEAHGCRFQAIDLRWGVSEEAGRDQQTMNICLTELKRCQDVSPRPNFIILLGDRYGWIPLPPQIEATEFDDILSKVSPQDRTLLLWDEGLIEGCGGWYRLDTNAVPAEYVLRPRREENPEEADHEAWGRTESRLREILLRAIESLRWSRDDRRRIKYECSATHQEIIEGALKLPDEREHVFAFLRTIQNRDDLPSDSDYTDANTNRAQTLKEAISRTRGVTCHSYEASWNRSGLESNLEQFKTDALESLTRIIEEELQKIQQIDELTRENIAHQEFGDERCRHFVGREEILDEIAAYTHGGQQSPLVVYGPSGSGKSALLAQAVLNAEIAKTHAYIIRRFIGATPESTDIRTLLRILCFEISSAFGFESLKEQELTRIADSGTEDALKQREAIEKKYGVPDEYRHLVETFREFIRMIPEKRRLVLFLDALDQLGATDNAHSLNWLPSQLPANIMIIASVLERDDDAGECLRSARSRFPESALLRIGEMSPEEGKEALEKLLVEAYPERKRALTAEQRENVLSGFSKCPSPLYLRLAFEEARRWRSYQGLPSVPNRVPGLAADVQGIVGDMLDRLKDPRQHGEVLVSRFLGLLAASRHGLSEAEILELLSENDAVMADLKARSARSPEAKGIPTVVWLRLYHDLSPYLIARSADQTVLYNFYHRVVGETIKKGYVLPAHHVALAKYFHQKADPNGDSTWAGNHAHALAELPCQQRKSESMWVELEETLTDLYFIEAKCKAGMVYDLVSDYAKAEWTWPGQEIEQQKEEERQEGIKVYADRLMEHAEDPDTNPLPEPPPLVEIRQSKSDPDEEHKWTPLECVLAWRHFVSTHTRPLGNGEESIFQMAWNWAASGPVAERVAELERGGRGPSEEWLKLHNRVPFDLNPVRLLRLEGPGERFSGVAITFDGCRAVAAGGDSHLNIYDLTTCERLAIRDWRASFLSCVSITPDGKKMLSGSISTSHDVCVWDIVTGECLRVLEGHLDEIYSVSITPDGRRAVSGSRDGTLRVWDLLTGNCQKILQGHEFQEGHVYGVDAVSITADGRRAVSGAVDGTVRLWSLLTGECLKVLRGHGAQIHSISITPDGKRAIIGSFTNLYLWDLITGELIRSLTGHTDLVVAVSITPDGQRALSGSWDGALRLWSLETGACLRELRGHGAPVTSVSMTPDGGRAVSVGTDRTLILWNLATGACPKELEGHSSSVSTLATTADGGRAVSGSEDGTLRVWDLMTGNCLKVLEGHTDRVEAVKITPDGSRMVSVGHRDGTLCVWDMQACKRLRILDGHSDSIHFISVTPDSNLVILGNAEEDKTLRTWNLSTGECLGVLDGHHDSISAVSDTPDGRLIVSGSCDGSLRVWDIAEGKCVRVLRVAEYPTRIRPVSILPDGRRIVSGGHGEIHGNYALRIWDLRIGERLKALQGHTYNVTRIRITPDGKQALSGSYDHTIRVFNLSTGKRLRVLKGHANKIQDLYLTHDGGRALALCPLDKRLLLWNMTTGKRTSVYDVGNSVWSIAVSGTTLIAGDKSGRVHILTLETYQPPVMVTTASRLWLFDPRSWDNNLTAVCMWCGRRFVVQDDWIGQEILCPAEGCGKPLKLNPFVCDNSDWLK